MNGSLRMTKEETQELQYSKGKQEEEETRKGSKKEQPENQERVVSHQSKEERGA